MLSDAELSESPRVFSIAVATESGDALQIAYGVPVSNVINYFLNWWEPGTLIGRFPTYDFTLMNSRSEPWDKVHKFPTHSRLDGAAIYNKRKSSAYDDLRNGDVLVSINRSGGHAESKLDKRGFVTDSVSHGDLRLSTSNHGFICSMGRDTTFTVWRADDRKVHTFKCRPSMPHKVQQANHQEYDEKQYALLGSLVAQNATPDFLRETALDDSDDEEEIMPSHKMFHVLRHMHREMATKTPHQVVVVSHFHPDSYISSDGNIELFDVIKTVDGVEIDDARHMESVVKDAAIKFAKGKKDIISLATESRTVYLDMHRLLGEETLVLSERGEPSKLQLLAETANNGGVRRVRKKRAAGKKRRSTRLQLKSILLGQAGAPECPSSRPSSAPGSPAGKKRRRSLRINQRN